MDSKTILAAFDDVARRRGWQALHKPKSLAMALFVEVGELCRHFQWRSDREIEALMLTREAGDVAAELADIQMYLIKLAAILDVDMEQALAEKIAENRRRCADTAAEAHPG